MTSRRASTHAGRSSGCRSTTTVERCRMGAGSRPDGGEPGGFHVDTGRGRPVESRTGARDGQNHRVSDAHDTHDLPGPGLPDVAPIATEADLGDNVDRATFLSLATIGVSGLIGAGVTLPVLGFGVL